jgi:DNA-binding beta-propeller fold protein YncE
MKPLSKLAGSFLTAALLASCGGTGNALSPSTPASNAVPRSQVQGGASRPQDAGREFVYVANQGSDNISAYVVNLARKGRGELTPVAGSPFAAGTLPCGVAVDPTGRFVYVANQDYPTGYGTIFAYAVNSISGALRELPGSPYAESDGPYLPATDPTGKFAYVTNVYSNNISGYRINDRGALKQLTGSPFATSGQPKGIAVSPAGRWVYVANTESNNVSAYAINASTGNLTEVAGSPYSAGTTPANLAVSVGPRGTRKYVYVTNSNSHDISGYKVNVHTGGLTPVAGSPFQLKGSPTGVTVDPTGKFAYVVVGNRNEVDAYTINTTSGALTQVAGSPFSAGTDPSQIAIDPNGNLAYVTNSGSDTVSAYTINTTSGSLTQVSGSPYGTGTSPHGIVVASPL